MCKNISQSYISFRILPNGSWVVQSVCLTTNWTTGRSGFDHRQRIFLLISVSKPALRPTKPPVQWYRRSFPLGKARPGIMLTTHPHLVPKSRMSRSYTSSSPSATVACSGTALLYCQIMSSPMGWALRNTVYIEVSWWRFMEFCHFHKLNRHCSSCTLLHYHLWKEREKHQIFWLQTERPGLDARQRQSIFLLASVSRPALRSTQPHIQWVLESFPAARSGRDADHSPHLVQRSRMNRSYSTSPLCACMA
jgi:hypothetical protein